MPEPGWRRRDRRAALRIGADELLHVVIHLAGATHVAVTTMGAGLRTVDEHLTALATVAENLPA